MPIAAYEITGLGVGRFESVNGRRIYYDLEGDSWYFADENEEGMYYDTSSYIKLTPGENTFVFQTLDGISNIVRYKKP